MGVLPTSRGAKEFMAPAAGSEPVSVVLDGLGLATAAALTAGAVAAALGLGTRGGSRPVSRGTCTCDCWDAGFKQGAGYSAGGAAAPPPLRPPPRRPAAASPAGSVS